MSFTAVLSLPGGDTVRVPLDDLGYTTAIDTDVLTNDNATEARLRGPELDRDGKHAFTASANPGR